MKSWLLGHPAEAKQNPNLDGTENPNVTGTIVRTFRDGRFLMITIQTEDGRLVVADSSQDTF